MAKNEMLSCILLPSLVFAKRIDVPIVATLLSPGHVARHTAGKRLALQSIAKGQESIRFENLPEGRVWLVLEGAQRTVVPALVR